jgi:hypothetical protein
MSVDQSPPGRWARVEGQLVFVREGETPEEALVRSVALEPPKVPPSPQPKP